MRKSTRFYLYGLGIFSIIPITLLWFTFFQPSWIPWPESWSDWLLERLDSVPCHVIWICSGEPGEKSLLLLCSFAILIFYAMLFAPSWGILRVWEFEHQSGGGKKAGKALYFVTGFLTVLQVLLLAVMMGFIGPWLTR
jgi:hypothetical protein